jgi:hypothetical protein
MDQNLIGQKARSLLDPGSSLKNPDTGHLGITKNTRVSYCIREDQQAKRLLNTTSHFLISDLVGHLVVFIKISLVPPMLKIDNFT